MVITHSQPAAQVSLWTKALVVFAVVAVAGLTLPIFTTWSWQLPAPTYISPLTDEATDLPGLTVEDQQLASRQAVVSARAHLSKAQTMLESSNRDQAQLLEYFNQALSLANQAVSLAPQSPASFLVRARVLAASRPLRPEALLLAQKDLEAAQALANGQSIGPSGDVALLPSNGTGLVLAGPGSESETSLAKAESNTTKDAATIPVGDSQTAIKDSSLLEDSYVYLIPHPDSPAVYLQSKSVGRMVVAASEPADRSIEFEYWIVNREK